MKSSLKRFAPLLAVASIATTLAPAAHAQRTVEQIKADLKQENIVQGEPTVTVSGSEVTVSTYRKENENQNDLKIDAVLIAKSVFAHDSALTRVNVRFCDIRNASDYAEVGVTIGDVRGYAAGAISKEQLLSALKLSSVGAAPVTVVPQPAATAAAEPATSTGTATSSAELSSLLGSSKPADSGVRTTVARSTASSANYSRYDAYGLYLQYPNGWTASSPKGTNVLVRFAKKGAANYLSVIDVKVYDAKKITVADLMALPPNEIFREGSIAAFKSALPDGMGQYFGNMIDRTEEFRRTHPQYRENYGHGTNWESAGVAPVKMPGALTIGAGRNIKAVQKAYWANSVFVPRQFMRTVVFASPFYVYQINLVSPEKDAAASSQDMDQILYRLTANMRSK